MTTVAFIGLGNMGSGMADNLVKSDYKVLAFDLSEAALTKAKEAGCTIAKSTEQAVSEADIVITMLPAGKHVQDIYSNQILASVRQGTLLIDCSTIDVETAKSVSELAEKKGLKMLDAPVSGGVAAAAGGTLTFMVGGDADAFDKAQGVLGAMGKKIPQRPSSQGFQDSMDGSVGRLDCIDELLHLYDPAVGLQIPLHRALLGLRRRIRQ